MTFPKFLRTPFLQNTSGCWFCAFHEILNSHSYKYPIGFSKSNYVKPKIDFMERKYIISIWRSFIEYLRGCNWKVNKSFPLFYKIRTKRPDHNDTIDFFSVNAFWRWNIWTVFQNMHDILSIRYTLCVPFSILGVNNKMVLDGKSQLAS